MTARRAIVPLASLILLTTAGCQVLRPVTAPFRGAYDILTGNTATKAALQMEDPESADARRRGINYLVARDYGKADPYTSRYRQIAPSDEVPLVRATAIRALNRARDAESTSVFVAALNDPSERVRLEAAKALANVPDPDAAPALLQLATDAQQDKDVRIAAADALKHYRNVEVARGLIDQLDGRDFGVAWQARRSLRALTGQDLRYDEAAWLNYLTTSQQPFG